ncbi:MAG: flagellar protein FlaI, partial [Thaumarchaeota archaeon]|nr:flagellar protein FlaI [Nitrososphaerota archaeon]
MPFDLSCIKDDIFVEAIKKFPHLSEYMEKYTAMGNPLPLFTDRLKPEHKKLKEPNLIYPISDQAFVHINPHTNSDDGYVEYVIIEPPMP